MNAYLPADCVDATLGEEIASSVTHGIGAALSIAALILMIVAAVSRGTALHVVSCAIYGSTLILLYLASTLYHALPNGTAKQVFRVLDHACIYLLIAGTYTPFTLLALRGAWGWTLFGLVWGLAAAGIVFKCFLTGRLNILSTVVYLVMGWIALIAIRPLMESLSGSAFLWVLAGGLAYSGGVVFFASRRRYAHTIWHLFVLAGSVCHFVAVYRYLLLSA